MNGHAYPETAVREVLLTVWNPVGLQDLPDDIRAANQDEYDAYILPIAALLRDGGVPATVAAYLQMIERNSLGLKAHTNSVLAAAKALSSPPRS